MKTREVLMKKLYAVFIFAFISVSGLTLSAAFADFRSSTINGPITCTTRGITVTINGDRSSFTITQTREPAVFNIQQDPQSNGSGFISFTGQLQMDHQKDEAVLTFSDQGDRLEIGGKIRPLKCPE
jgi:hypothetical protein